MKNRKLFVLALLLNACVFFGLGALSESATANLLEELQRRYYNAGIWRSYAAILGVTPDPYAAGFLDGMQYAINGDYNAVSRNAGQGDQWIEQPKP